jgi:hypothetical protein
MNSTGTKFLIKFYKRQLEMMYERGLNKRTEDGWATITPTLINATRKRLNELENRLVKPRKELRAVPKWN